MLTIALDYDDTFTADPKLWWPFIGHAKRVGHRVICVTYRMASTPIEDVDLAENVEVFYTEGQQKNPYMESRGIDVDIWIDDMPQLISGHNEHHCGGDI